MKPTAAPKARKVGKKAATVEAGSNKDLVMGVLRKGPSRAGAVIKALKGQVKDSQVYTMLNYLKAHGLAKVNDDRTYELVKG